MAKETKVKDIDITKTGPQSFRQLQQANNADFSSEISPEVRDFIEKKRQRAQSFTLYDPYRQAEQEISSPLSGTTSSWGESMFDEKTATEAQFQELGDIRAENQPWYTQIGAGLAKGAILAGTTFLDGTIGLALGAIQAGMENRFSALWDNEFSKAMQSVNEWSEQALPNYYTDAERNEPWYENVFTANFLGDKFIKNLGFTIGAFYSGGVTAAGLKASILPQIIGAVSKSSKAPAIITSGIGATISAVNEGRIEALNNSTDWFELQKAQLDDQHKARLQAIEQYRDTEMYYSLLAQENANYEATIGKLTEDRLKMGNADLLMNIPILTASNLIQFGRLYANGFKTARKATNIVGKAGEYATGKTAGKGIAKSLLSPLSEGTEELAQKAASVVSGVYYEDDVNNFYKAKIDPQAEQETVSWIKAFAEGINQTVNDDSSWEEFFIGTLTGALGMPRFRGIRSSEGKLQSPITLEEGVLGKYGEYRDQMDRETKIANYMNNRVSSPEFINYYQGLIRHNKYQRDMNQAVENNDAFEFKNAEHAQLISDIVMFDNAGRLEDLVTLINSAYNTSDENLVSIVENTTSTLEDSSKVGPFVDKNGNPMYSTPEGRQEMISKLTQTKDEMLSAITNYTKIKDDIDINTGQQLEDEQLEELTFIQAQINNWQDRRDALFLQIEKPLREELNFWDLGDSALTSLLSSKNSKQFIKNLTPSIMEEIVTVILPQSDLSATDISNIITAVEDMSKIQKGIEVYNSKLKEYLENPTKLKNDIASSTESIVEEEAKKKSDTLKGRLLSATNLSEFRQALSTEGDTVIREETLKSLEEEGNQLAKNYREVKAYNTEVQRAINSLDEDPAIKADALKLLQDLFENSSNLEEIANPNSIYVDNADALYDDRLSLEENTRRFQEAQYALLRAMNQINNDNRFKDRFSQDYRTLREKGKPNPTAPTKDTTGDSGTSTIPPVNGEGLPVVTYEPPVGNVTGTQVNDENKQINERVETPQSMDSKQKGRRLYYRPSIPELHIQASKEGDFRPFNVVAAEREKGVNFDELYNYLKDNGAFTYVNEGSLKAGDELGFMIDPEFEKRVEGMEWHKDPTIFLIDKKNGQVVGSLDEGKSVINFEGLAGLEEKIKEEYSSRSEVANIEDVLYITRTEDGYTPLTKLQEWSKKTGDVRTNPDGVGTYKGLTYYKIKAGYRGGDNVTIWFRNTPSKRVLSKVEELLKEDKYNLIEVGNLILEEINKENARAKFIATPTTRVSQVMVGRIPYGNEERNLANIPNVSSENRVPIFGIIKNGKLDTNKDADNKINYDDIIKPANMDNKEGRMYLLIPNAAGKYSPVAVRVKHFNRSEFNPEDITVQGTKVFNNIQEAINALANSLSEDDLNNAVRLLKQNIYTGELHIDWFTSDAGNGIRFTKVQRDAQGNEIYEHKNGQRVRKEVIKTVFLTEKWDQNTIYSITESNDMQTVPTSKNIEEVAKEVTNILLDFNLPIQVNLGMLNRGGYNNMLINSGILTSNITDARVISSWFTTDYFDINGNLQRAVNPVSVASDTRRGNSPVGGNEGVKKGTQITVGNTVYYVDLAQNIITDANGKRRGITTTDELLVDLAWAQDNFGNATQSSMMVDNKVVTPSGRVLDRGTQRYLSGEEAQRVKDKIAGRERTTVDTKKVIAQIEENQRKVDKTRTDEEYYYILEEDGQYHEYERVHSRLGSNWVESKKQADALRDTRIKLSQLVDNVTQYNNYLANLSNHYGVDLTAYNGKTDAKSRDTIVSIIRDNMAGTNSQRALNAGNSVDSVIRNFFISNDTPIKPDNMSERAFTDLLTSLTEIKSNIEARGERFLTNNIVLFQKYSDGTRIAGEVDILSVDKDGNFRIYDVKTNKYSFYDFTDKYGHQVNYFRNKSVTRRMSDYDYYTLQLSAYKNLFESQYGVPITKLAILPFVLSYDRENVSGVQKEKGILIDYNPSVNVPLVGNVQTSKPVTPTKPVNNYIATKDRLKERKDYGVVGSPNPEGVEGKDFLMLPFEYEYEGKKREGKYSIIKIGDTYYIWNLNTLGNKEDWHYTWEVLPNKYLEKAKELFGETPASITPQVLPMFETSLETQNPVDRVLPENSLGNTSVIGYYEKDGKLYKGYVRKVGVIGDIPIYITKERDRGFGREGELNKSSSYFVILPNGKLVDTKTLSKSDDEAATVIMKALSAKPQKVKDLAVEKTILFDPDAVPAVSATPITTVETPATINQGNTQTGAAYTAQKEQAINNHDEEFEDEFSLYESKNNDFFNNDDWGKNIKKIQGLNLEVGKEYNLDTVEELFNRFFEGDSEQKALADKVFKVAKSLGLKIKFDNNFGFGVKGQYTNNNIIRYNHKFFTDDFLNNTKSAILLHEVIHAATMYILSDNMQDRLEGNLKEAADAMKEAFDLIKGEKSLAGEYGLTNAKEMMAELANSQFRNKLKRVGIWDRIKNAIKKLFFFDTKPASNAYEVLSRALDVALDNFNIDLYNDYNGVVDDLDVGYNPNEWAFYKHVSTIRKIQISSEVRTWYSRNVFNNYNINMMIDNNNDGYILLDYLYTFHYNKNTGEIENITPIYKNTDYNRNRINKWRERFDKRTLGNTEVAFYSSWGQIDEEVKNTLSKKGWTQEKFNSISQIERDYAIRCASI